MNGKRNGIFIGKHDTIKVGFCREHSISCAYLRFVFFMVLFVLVLFTYSAQALSKEGWLWPVPGHRSMSRGFYYINDNDKHRAIDIDPGYGVPVHATKSGYVIRIWYGCNGNYGPSDYSSCTSATCAPKVVENFGAYSSTDYKAYSGGFYSFGGY